MRPRRDVEGTTSSAGRVVAPRLAKSCGAFRKKNVNFDGHEGTLRDFIVREMLWHLSFVVYLYVSPIQVAFSTLDTFVLPVILMCLEPVCGVL